MNSGVLNDCVIDFGVIPSESPFFAPPLQLPPFSLQHPEPPFARALAHEGVEKDCAESRIDRYPVHRQRLPSNASSIASSEGVGSFLSKAYKLWR